MENHKSNVDGSFIYNKAYYNILLLHLIHIHSTNHALPLTKFYQKYCTPRETGL